MNAVTVLLSFSQFAANQADSNHSAVASHHFTGLRASRCEIKDSYFVAVGLLNSFEFRSISVESQKGATVSPQYEMFSATGSERFDKFSFYLGSQTQVVSFNKSVIK